MLPLFVYGTLIKPDIQQSVIGRLCALTPAALGGYEVKQGRWPYLSANAGAIAQGFLMTDLTEAELVKLDEYERIDEPGMDRDIYERCRLDVRRANGANISAWVYLPLLAKWPHDWLETAHA
jgi:gamma-glutamylcyclotransferase (GGCT)/AIG2-like uncharacterized protein YtfP